MRFLGLMLGVGLGLSSLGWGQTAIVRVGQDNTNTSGYQNFNAGTLGLPRGNTDPATCSVGDRFVNTTTTPGVSKICTSTNTWVLDVLSGGALTSGRVPYATTDGLLTDSAGLQYATTANVTTLTLTAGSSQSSTNLFEIKTNAAALNAALNSSATTWHMRTGLNVWSAAPVGSGFLQAAYQDSALFATGKGIIFSSTNQADGTPDASLSRISAGVIGAGTGATGSVAGSERAASFQASGGTKFTISGCSAGTTVGGASAGTFVSGTTGACTVTITINGATGLTAPTGWSCFAANQTTPANIFSQSGSTTTTATFTGTTVTNDVISFGCLGY